VEIKKDSAVPGGDLEVGMMRVVGGYEEEITAIIKNTLIEYKINSGLPSSFHKARVVFKPVVEDGGNEKDAKSTHIIWTILWSPSSFAMGMVYKLMMTGFCNVALYNLERKISGLSLAENPGEDSAQSDDGPVDMTVGLLKEGEIPKLQYAARLQTGYEGNLTSQQAESLKELLDTLKAKDPEVYDLLQKHPDGAQRMSLRFLRAECHGKNRDFNVQKSIKRLSETLKFRRDIGADEMINGKPPATFSKFSQIGAELEVIDREGRVVVFSRTGLLSVYLDPKALTDEEWKKNLVCITENRLKLLRESSKKLGHEVSATVVVYDLKGMSFASRNIIPFTKVCFVFCLMCFLRVNAR